MLLHEFMVAHRDEILQVSRARVRRDVIETGELDQDGATFFDEIVQALRYYQGRTRWRSPLPDESEAAARLGEKPQRAGLEPSKLPQIFSAISHAIGYTGERYGLVIDAGEYNVLNQCIETGIVTSIQHFWNIERTERERTERERTERERTSDFACSLHELGDAPRAATLEPRPIQVARILRQVQASSASERAVNLTLDVDESLCTSAEEAWLTSAVSELVYQAVHASCTGAHVILRCRADDGAVVVEVEDAEGGLAATVFPAAKPSRAAYESLASHG